MKNKNDNKGFTLVEIMLAVAVLSIIVVSFSGAFSSGFRSIQQSRKEITNLNESQSELEEKIASEAFDRAQTLNLHFNNQESIEVPGAIVEKNEVRTFLPDVPVITSVNITPNGHIYGLEPEQWDVEINTRGVEDNSEIKVYVYQQNDPDTVLISNTENEIVDESALFSIDIPTEKESRLTDDLYYFRFEVEGVNGELDKYYTVRGINYIALGKDDTNNKLLASSDHKQWGILEAERAELGFTIDFDNIKAGTWGGEVDDRKFVIVGDEGKAYSSNDGVYWEDISTDSEYDFEDVVWDEDAFVAAGSENSKAFVIEYDSTGWSSNLIPADSGISVNKLLFIEDGIDGSPSVLLAAGELDNGSDNLLFYNINDSWNIKNIIKPGNQETIDMVYNPEENRIFIIEKNDSELIKYNFDESTFQSNEYKNSFNSIIFFNPEIFEPTTLAFGNSGIIKVYDGFWKNNFENPIIPELPSDYTTIFSAHDSLAIENDLLILGEKKLGAVGLVSEIFLLEYNYEIDNYSWKSLSDLSLLDSDSDPLYDFENDFPYPIIDIISK